MKKRDIFTSLVCLALLCSWILFMFMFGRTTVNKINNYAANTNNSTVQVVDKHIETDENGNKKYILVVESDLYKVEYNDEFMYNKFNIGDEVDCEVNINLQNK